MLFEHVYVERTMSFAGHISISASHCQVMPSMLQLISQSFWAKSSSEAVREHLAEAQSLNTHRDRDLSLDTGILLLLNRQKY